LSEGVSKMSKPELVDIDEAIERWSDIYLADGSHVRVKYSVFSVERLPLERDSLGNPAYRVNGAPVMGVVSSPLSDKQ